MRHQTIVVLNFGGQVNQLVARKVRQLGVYCEVLPATTPMEEIKAKNPIGIVTTGFGEQLGEFSQIAGELKTLNVPILATEFGAQLFLEAGEKAVALKETGKIALKDSPLFAGVGNSILGYRDSYLKTVVPAGFTVIATANDQVVAVENEKEKVYLLQFSPEVSETENGEVIIKNFLYKICGAKGDWSMGAFADVMVAEIKAQVGSGKVLLALSGGVDSSVVATLLEKAVGEQLYCIFVDHGFMRKNEGKEVEDAFGNSGMNFVRINAENRFLAKLKGVTDPETKRKIIGEEFIRVFEEEAGKIGAVDFFAQGTIYPDIIESDMGDGTVIKSHHNVGGLPDHVDFKEIVEPLKLLFKDEVRALGVELGLPEYLAMRQPFPGPGLAVRVIGELTKDKLDTLRDADFIFREEIANAGLAGEINQYFAVLTNIKSVGVTNDTRTYDYTVALRGVVTTDFMTAKWAKIPYEVLEKVSGRICSEVTGVNRVVYDITAKPPATIEWE